MATLSTQEPRNKSSQLEVSQKKYYHVLQLVVHCGLTFPRTSPSATSNHTFVNHFTNGTTAYDDVDNLADDVDRTMASVDNIRQSSQHTIQLCPYHENQTSQTGRSLTELDPMDRFLIHDVSEQSSICYGPQEGTLSITKPCTCDENIRVGRSNIHREGDFDANQRSEAK
jgi:hypothetical protein